MPRTRHHSVRLRSAVCIATIGALLIFLAVVYWPFFIEARTGIAPLSVLSDCSDARTAHIAVVPSDDGSALVNVALEDVNGAASSGKCSTLQILFPGKTSGGEIVSDEVQQLPF